MWSCTFHQNVVKLVGYTIEPSFYIATKLYEIDLFTLIHHPDETISPLLGLKLAGYLFVVFSSSFSFCSEASHFCVFSDIAAAMSYMQDVGIVHRDLKSANVLLETVPINQTQSMLRGEFFCFLRCFFPSCFSEPSISVFFQLLCVILVLLA